jgi:hypothetical protein
MVCDKQKRVPTLRQCSKESNCNCGEDNYFYLVLWFLVELLHIAKGILMCVTSILFPPSSSLILNWLHWLEQMVCGITISFLNH